jgi:hypothetical protein
MSVVESIGSVAILFDHFDDNLSKLVDREIVQSTIIIGYSDYVFYQV